DDGDDTRGRYQGADRHAEDETDDRKRHAEIDDSDGHIMDEVCFPWLAVESDVDVNEADDRPREMGPPQDPRRLGEQRGKTLRVDPIRLMRSDAPNVEHKAHAGEEQVLDDQATCRTAFALNVPHDDAGNSQNVDQNEREEVVITKHGGESPIMVGRVEERP